MTTVKVLLDFRIDITSTAATPVTTSFTQASASIRRYSVEETTDGLSDDALIELWNEDGNREAFTRQGYTVEIFEQYGGEGSLTLKWKGIIARRQINPASGGTDRSLITISCVDFVYWHLVANEVNVDVSAKDIGAIIKDLIDAITDTPLDTTNINNATGTTLDYKKDGVNILSVINEVRESALFTFWSQQPNLAFFKARASLSSGKTIGEDKVVGISIKLKEEDTDLINDVTVTGQSVVTKFASQETQTGFFTASSTVRKLQKITVSSGTTNIPRVDIFIDKTVETGTEAVITRIQQDDGTGLAPFDEANAEKDITSKVVPHGLLASGDFTPFLFPGHQLESGRDYWIIVETDGTVGEAIGQDGSSNLTYKAFEATTISATASDTTSQDDFGKRSKTIDDPSITSTTQAQAIADGIIARNKDLQKTVTFTANNTDAFDVVIGRTAVIDLPDFGLSSSTMVLIKRFRLVNPRQHEIQLELTFATGDTPIDVPALMSRQETRISSTEKNISAIATQIAEHGSGLHQEVFGTVPLPLGMWILIGETTTGPSGVVGLNMDDGVATDWETNFTIPEEADDTQDAELIIYWLMDTNETAKVWKLDFEIGSTSIGSVYSADFNTTVNVTIPDNNADKHEKETIVITAATYSAGDTMSIRLSRDGLADSSNSDGLFLNAIFRFKTKFLGGEEA